MKVVVVESPAKAKTINKYLGKGYEVLASFGHIRDLPPKDGSVDPDADFKMIWEIESRGAKRVSDIARAVKGAEKLILATDPDREGEAISWHVLEALNEKRALKGVPVERVTFNAITKDAVQTALRQPRAAPSITSSVSPFRPCSGASSPGRARPAVSNPSPCASCATGNTRSRPSGRARTGRSSPRSRRETAACSRPGSSAPTARRSTVSTSERATRRRPSSGTSSSPPSGSRTSRRSRSSATRRRPS